MMFSSNVVLTELILENLDLPQLVHELWPKFLEESAPLGASFLSEKGTIQTVQKMSVNSVLYQDLNWIFPIGRPSICSGPSKIAILNDMWEP